MQLTFENISGSYFYPSIGRACTGIVCGNGSSLIPFHDAICRISNPFDNNFHRFFCCNEADQMTRINFDYWVFCNSVFTIQEHWKRMRQKRAVICYAEEIDKTPRKDVEKYLEEVHYLPYDQRHIEGQPCRPRDKCCEFIEQGRETLQEHLMKISGHKECFGGGYTVAIPMLAIAVITGCNPIYIIGVDLDYSKGYVDGKTTNNLPDFKDARDYILNSFRIIKESAGKLGISIFNMNKESNFDTFEYKIPTILLADL